MSQIPAVVGQHLDAIQFDKDGHLFLASSQLTYRYWNGSIWHFADSNVAPNVERCDAGIDITHGVADLKLANDKIIIGTDSGSVSVFELTQNGTLFEELVSLTQHDDLVTSISVSSNQSCITSASQDKRIIVWDLNSLEAQRIFKGHYGSVNSANFHPKDTEIFISCAQDGRIVLWDLRKPKPASIIDSSFFPSMASCIEWQPTDDHGIVAGTETGHMLMIDTRQQSTTALQIKPHTRSIHRMTFAPRNPTWLASVSEDCTTVVTEFTAGAADVIYRDRSHDDFVQGVAWHPDGRLFTCGWDKKVVNKTVEPQADTAEKSEILNLNPNCMDSTDEPLVESGK